MGETEHLSELRHELAQAEHKNERRLCLLSGAEGHIEYALTAIKSAVSKSCNTLPVCYFCAQEELTKSGEQTSSSTLTIIDDKSYRQWLGRESRLLIFDGGQHWNPDIFAALAGTVVGGGLVIFISRSENQPTTNLPLQFNQYFLDRLAGDGATVKINLDTLVSEQSSSQLGAQFEALFSRVLCDWLQQKRITPIEQHTQEDGLCATRDQFEAVEQIIKVNRGHRDRPLVITADRGRGKSTALAIACVRLLRLYEHDSPAKQFVICAPQKKSLSVFYQHLLKLLPDAKVSGHQVSFRQHSLRFMPIDELLQNPLSCHLLLIDEAAGFPVPLLTKLLAYYHRIVFSSTVHGYEGAGRGFTLKFLATLAEEKPQFRQQHIKTPIRWADSDPLERALNKVLLLDAQLPPFDEFKSNMAAPAVEEKGQIIIAKGTDLIAQPQQLEQVFSLLVIAHYQTKPSDLKLLLDEPSNVVVMLYQENLLVGAALLVAEGAIDADLAKAVACGKRRLKGHLVPQMLATQAGYTELLSDKLLRVMRIAVHPQMQSCGAGSRLLAAVEDYAKTQAIDWLAVSFGANVSLMKFWLDNGYHFVRLGVSRDAASGEYAATMLLPLVKAKEQLLVQICQRYLQDFRYLVSGHFAQLDTELSMLLVNALANSSKKPAQTTLSLFDLSEADAFVNGERQLQHCAPALARLLWHTICCASSGEEFLMGGKVANTQQWHIGFGYLNQQQGEAEIVNLCGLSGKKQLIVELQAFIRQLLAWNSTKV